MKNIFTKRNVVIGGLIALGLFIGWRWRVNSTKKTEVKTVTAQIGDISQTIGATGKILAEKQVTLNFPSTGKVAYLNVSEGQRVTRGQALVGLDKGDLKAAETAAYYKYLAADANAKEVEDGVKNHSTDESFAQKNGRVAAQTARDIAYDTWLTARRATANADLVAPIDGIVTDVSVSTVRDTVGVADGITIVDPDSLYFETEIDESDVRLVSVGTSVKLTLDAFPKTEFAGTIYRIGYVARTSSSGATVFPMWVRLGGDTSLMRIGMAGDVTVVVAEMKNIVKVPQVAVSNSDVEVLRDGKVIKVPVKTGLENDREIQITEGLNPGEQVVVP